MASVAELFEQHKENLLMQGAVRLVAATILTGPVAEENLRDALRMISDINERFTKILMAEGGNKQN